MIFSTKILETLFVFNGLTHNIKIFLSKKTSKHVTYVAMYYNIYKIFFFLKNSVQNYYLSLLDIMGVDVSLLNIKSLVRIAHQPYNRLFTYNLINYKTNQKYFFLNLSYNNKQQYSIDKLFLNANWLERELIEFFNTPVINKTDTRNLLLDYNFTAAPLLKSFPTEGYQELFFNFNTFNLDYVQNEFIEL